MESWGDMAEKISDRLIKNGYEKLADEMNLQYGAGGTAGEMFTILCVWLAKMRNSKNEAYTLIKKDAEILLNYAVQLKYFTNNSLDRL
ncbi:MAG TPA: hypothetical protein PLA68_17720 [Panacibacter sp.]|nr:hypothetical protein [Panacibacter sp.]